MTEKQATHESPEIYRVDKFIVPAQGREEFVDKVQETHELLRTQPGFTQDFILEQSAGPDEFNFITIVEWENTEAVENAQAAVMAMRKESNFNPEEMFTRLGIEADFADYERIDG